MQASSVTVQTGDAAAYRADQPFDRALVDPPCSGLGTLQGHPDLRWRVTPETIEAVAQTQRAILAAATAALAPGGTLVYSTCTLSRRENEDQIAGLDLRVDAERTLLPHRDGTDGFYIARMRKPDAPGCRP